MIAAIGVSNSAPDMGDVDIFKIGGEIFNNACPDPAVASQNIFGGEPTGGECSIHNATQLRVAGIDPS